MATECGGHFSVSELGQSSLKKQEGGGGGWKDKPGMKGLTKLDREPQSLLVQNGQRGRRDHDSRSLTNTKKEIGE